MRDPTAPGDQWSGPGRPVYPVEVEEGTNWEQGDRGRTAVGTIRMMTGSHWSCPEFLTKRQRLGKGMGRRVVRWNRKTRVNYDYCLTGKGNLQAWRHILDDDQSDQC